MTIEIAERVLLEARHIIATHDTVRKTAILYGVSKSTVHNDMSVKLRNISHGLFRQIQIILQENFKEKHIRGGNSTKLKYLNGK